MIAAEVALKRPKLRACLQESTRQTPAGLLDRNTWGWPVDAKQELATRGARYCRVLHQVRRSLKDETQESGKTTRQGKLSTRASVHAQVIVHWLSENVVGHSLHENDHYPIHTGYYYFHYQIVLSQRNLTKTFLEACESTKLMRGDSLPR